MHHRPRLFLGVTLTVFAMALALVPAATATATLSLMQIATDTTLTADHTGQIEIVAGNVTLDCDGHKVTGIGSGNGIELKAAAVTVRNCEVSGFRYGILLGDAGGGLVEENHVHDNGTSEFSLGIGGWGTSNNTIRNNLVERSGNHGISLSEGSEDNTVNANTVLGNENGIVLWMSDNNTVTNNEARSNESNGFGIGKSHNTIVTGNEARNNGKHGFGIGEAQNTTVTNNEAWSNGYAGFSFHDSQDSIVLGNTASENVVEGFFGSADSTGTFTNNDAHRNGDWGFEVDPTASTFKNNYCIGNGLGGSLPSGWCSESGRFSDDDGSVFEFDIEWMAKEGITKGCNPPTNDRFCPNNEVTRGQMAAFLVRALDLPDAPSAGFVDTVGTTFEKDIDKLAAAGITKGCNPPVRDRFCPDDKVRREVMAAFLVRAMKYTDNGGGDLFVDDDGSIFENDIDKLATAGVTKGCNPPKNDEFCPTRNVTRGQMAAFMRRALS